MKIFKVVLIDDEPWAIDDMRYFLGAHKDFEIVQSFSGADKAWEYIKNNPVDVVFTDIKMNNTTGLELAEKAKSENLKTKFVMVSAYDEFSYALKALHIGAVDYLMKPLTEQSINQAADKIRNIYNAALNAEECYRLPEVAGISGNFKELIEYLENNYMLQMKMGDVAKRFNISESYCTQLCQKYYQMGYSRILTKIRMENALRLLKNEKLEIKEIAVLAGFDDYAYFNRKFKKYFNMTPNQMRMRNKKNHE